MHNRKILQKSNANTAQACNCKKFECPVKDQKLTCRTESVIYEATVKAEDNSEEEKTYIGLTGMEFKQRHYQHRHDFQNENKRESTELSKHIWKLKDKNINYNIRWKIIKQVPKIKKWKPNVQIMYNRSRNNHEKQNWTSKQKNGSNE